MGARANGRGNEFIGRRCDERAVRRRLRDSCFPIKLVLIENAKGADTNLILKPLKRCTICTK